MVQKAVILADVFIAAIFLSETSRDHARLDKPQLLIQMTCMDVAFHHCIELKDTESRFAGFFHAVSHQLFSDMLSTACCAHRKTGIADVTAASRIVGMQDIQTGNPALFIFCHSRIAL